MIVDWLLCREVINQDDIEVYLYGMIQLLTYVFNIVLMIIISVVLGEWWQGMLFMITFFTLRTYAGGYHAGSSKRCFLLSIGVFATALLVMKYVKVSDFICWGLMILSSVIILCMSPVEAINKPLDDIEKKLYRKKSIVIWSVEIIASIFFMLFDLKEIAVCVVLAQVVVGCSLISGRKKRN